MTKEQQEFMNTYAGHWFLKTDEECALHAISITRNTIMISNDDYSKGYITACKHIENKFRQLLKEKNERS
jgi:hypothetical protein